MDIHWILQGYALQDDKPEAKQIWNKTWIEPLEIRNEVTQAVKGMFYGKCNKRLKFVLLQTIAYTDTQRLEHAAAALRDNKLDSFLSSGAVPWCDTVDKCSKRWLVIRGEVATVSL